ncbi:MAG: hypothetical protein RIS08_106 [Actinomycetota bacterium]|jgi:DNA-binding MarR family transcriptional regulator
MANQRITFTLNHVVSLLNASADRLLRAHFNLTYSQFLFLVTLESLERPTASFLAECLGVSRAAVSQRLPWFQDRGFLEVAKRSGNNKNLSLSLTKKGVDLANSSADFLEGEFRALFQGIGSVDLKQLDLTLNKIKQGLLTSEGARDAA